MLHRVFILGLLTLLACDRQRSAGGDSELRYLGSHGQVLMIELADDLGHLAPLRLRYMGAVLGGPESIQAVASGDTDFGNAAIGSVIRMIAAGAPIQQVIASNGVDEGSWNGFFVLEGSPLRSARDLMGKRVALNTLGAHAEFVLREFLSRDGLTRAQAAEVTMVVTPPLNGEQTLRLGQVDVASLSGVFRDRALRAGGLRLLFSDRQLFGNFNSVDTVFNTRFIAQHPETVRKFVDGVARAIEWAREQPVEVVHERMRQVMIRRKRGEDPSLVQFWHSVGIKSRGGVLGDEDMKLWVDWLIASGELDPKYARELSRFYDSSFHPFRSAASAQL